MDFLKKLQSLENKSSMIVITGNCSVRYSGRAESHLASGDRLIIIKSDNAVLIHQPTGTSPINYMKSGAIWSAEQTGNDITIRARESKEMLDIALHKIFSINSWNLKDGLKLNLIGTERDMSDMIYANLEMVEQGMRPVSIEEQTEYGFIDVMATDRDGVLTVIECKRYVADLKAVSQLRRYVEKIKKSKGIDEVRGIICAPHISPNAQKMLSDWDFSFKSIRPPKHLEEFEHDQTSLGDY